MMKGGDYMEETIQNTSGGANKMTFIGVAVIALLLLGGVVFFMSQNSAKNNENAQVTQQISPAQTDSMSEEENETAEEKKVEGDTVTGAMEKPSGTAEKGTIKEFAVTGKNFSFNPSEIKVKKGDTVRITFTSVGGFHDWVVDEFENAETKQLQSGQSDTIEFVADKAGTFEYYCSVGNHRQMGMVGNLIVE